VTDPVIVADGLRLGGLHPEFVPGGSGTGPRKKGAASEQPEELVMQQHPTIGYRIATLHQHNLQAEARRDRDAALARGGSRRPVGIGRALAALARCYARRRDDQASATAGAPTSLAR
jgi:hypothetical protein